MLGEDEQSMNDHIAYLKAAAAKGSLPEEQALIISMKSTCKKRMSLVPDLKELLEEFPIMRLEGMVSSFAIHTISILITLFLFTVCATPYHVY